MCVQPIPTPAPKPFMAIATAIAMAIAQAACVDGPMSPALDDTLRDVSLDPGGRVFPGIAQEELDRLDRESELGYPAERAPVAQEDGLGDRKDEKNVIGAVPDPTRRAVPGSTRNAPDDIAARRLNLDIPEVCRRNSSALDFPNGWIHFDDHCDALLAAKDQLRGTVALNWDTATAMTEWEGVVLGRFGVERLYLHHRGLDGSLPPELGALDDLEVLSLGRNELTGGIPTELGSMTDLERLYLQDNQLTGEIPAEVGTMRSLERLYLWRNQLSGAIPRQLGSLRQLEQLYLGGNQLTGRIPAQLGSLRSLRRLSLWGNELAGPIPGELGNLSYLMYVTLSRNQLSGGIPSKLAELRNIESLYLYGNQLTGSIPSPTAGAWEQLRILSLYDNQLTGEIPANLQNTDLYYIAVSTNDGLTGPLPLELQTLLLSSFYWGETGLCSPSDPSFQAWLASIDEERYSGGPVCGSESGGGDFQAFSGLRINNNGSLTLRAGGITLSAGNTGCIRGGGTYNGQRYEYHWSAWQRNTGSGWTEVSGSRQTGGLCGYNLTSAPSGRYRLVGDMTLAGVRGNYKSENEVTVGGGVSNQSPVIVDIIPDTVMMVGDSITGDASDYFSDPDGDTLSYRATSSNTSVATVRLSGSIGTVTAVAEGRATIRVTATDPGGLSAEQSFTVTVGSSAACTEDLGTIPNGTTVTRTGSWDGSCRSTHYTNGEYARYYNFMIAAPVSVRIDLTSPSVDTWLALRRGAGTGGSLIESDDDGGTGGNSRITRTLAAGMYTIEATTFRGGVTGPFTLTLAVSGGGSNRSPVTVGTISAKSVDVGESVSVNASSYFSDPDGDALTYTASSSRTSVATASVSGRTVTVAGVAAGTATIRITATDPGGLSAVQTLSVTVEAGGGGDFQAFSGLRINNNGSVTLQVGGITLSVGNTGCIRGGGTYNGQRYEYHWSAWQRNTGSGWTEVSGSRQTGGLCGYDLTSAPSGRYRLVGDMTLAGVRGNYKSENEVTR